MKPLDRARREGASHDRQCHPEAGHEPVLVQLELRGVVRVGPAVGGLDADPEVTARPLAKEEAHVVARHGRFALLDEGLPQRHRRASTDEGCFRLVVDAGRT